MLLVVVDSHSKWLEVLPMSSTTAGATIDAIRMLFARYGLPLEIVSDNGPQFRAEEFKEFLRCSMVKHTLCPPYHPASNGLAERHIQTFKNMFKKNDGDKSLLQRVAEVLLHYRNTPHTTTGKTPAELFLKRLPRTVLSLVKPCLQSRVEKKQQASKSYQDGAHPRVRMFDVYQQVRVRNFRGGKERWTPATIIEVTGPETYMVRMPGNVRRAAHANHLIPDDTIVLGSTNSERATGEMAVHGSPASLPSRDEVGTGVSPAVWSPHVPEVVPTIGRSSPRVPEPELPRSFDTVSPRPETGVESGPGMGSATHSPVKATRSGRVVKAPRRLDL